MIDGSRADAHDARPAAASYSSLGMRFRLRSSNAVLLARLQDLYRACANRDDAGVESEPDIEIDIDGRGAQRGYAIRMNGVVQCQVDADADALAWCAWLVNRAATERHDPSRLVLHAAAAATGPDASGAVVLVGESGAGKSTLASALTRAGYAYMGDDGVALGLDDMRVRANPKPIALDPDSRRALEAFGADALLAADSDLVAPSALGAALAAERHAAPMLIVQPRYRAGATPSAMPISAACAAGLLADQSFNFAAIGAPALRAVAAVARRAPAVVLEYSDLADAVVAIADAIGIDQPATRAGDRSYRVGDLDVEVLDGEALVWDGAATALHHLNAPTTRVWSAYTESATAPEIGAPLAPAETAECLRDLVARNLLPPEAISPR